MDEPIMSFKGEVDGKNAQVILYTDRLEWAREGGASKAKIALGAATWGLSLAKTGLGKKGEDFEILLVDAIGDVTTEKDGFRNSKLRISTNGGTLAIL